MESKVLVEGSGIPASLPDAAECRLLALELPPTSSHAYLPSAVVPLSELPSELCSRGTGGLGARVAEQNLSLAILSAKE